MNTFTTPSFPFIDSNLLTLARENLGRDWIDWAEEVLQADGEGLTVSCADGHLILFHSLRQAADYVRGHRVSGITAITVGQKDAYETVMAVAYGR